MKIRYSRLIAFTALFFTFLFQNCDGDEGCGGVPYRQGNVISYKLETLRLMDGILYVKTFSPDSVRIDAGDTLWLELSPVITLAENFKPGSGSLMACTPFVQDIKMLGDTMKMYTSDSLDAAHPAGSDISAFFVLRKPNYSGGSSMYSLEPLHNFGTIAQSDASVWVGLTIKPPAGVLRLEYWIYSPGAGDRRQLQPITFLQ